MQARCLPRRKLRDIGVGELGCMAAGALHVPRIREAGGPPLAARVGTTRLRTDPTLKSKTGIGVEARSSRVSGMRQITASAKPRRA